MFALIVLLLLLCACQPAPPAWVTLAEAPQGRAPALYADAARVTAFWVGADAAGVHHDARHLSGGELSPVTVLPLPPTHPYDQRVYPASGGSLFLLWLDRVEGAGVTTLLSAWIAPDLSIRRTTPVSDGLALRYSAAPDGQGGLWAVWSGGLLSEPTLYARYIDAEGRPLDHFRIAAHAETPALVRANDGTLLFWIQAGQVMRARLVDGLALDAESITSAVSLAPGDRLYEFSAGLDESHAYVFWNITRANGQVETWYAAGTFDARFWNAPVRLLDAEDRPLRWLSPAVGQFEQLHAAAESAAGVGIAAFDGGALVDVRVIVPDVSLIGTPALVMRPNGERVLAWAAPELPRARLHLLELNALNEVSERP